MAVALGAGPEEEAAVAQELSARADAAIPVGGLLDADADDEDEIGPFQRVGQGQSSAGGEGDEEDEEDPLGGDNSDVSESAFGA